MYLDDIIIIGHSTESAREAVRLAVSLFESLGFVIQDEKTVLEPSQLRETGAMRDMEL
jgi:hypothetical protein